MHTQPEQPSDPGGDTLPEFPAVVDYATVDIAKEARRARRRRSVRQAFEASTEFAKAAPELVLEFIEGILP